MEIERKLRTNKADYLKVRKAGQVVPSTEKFLKQLLGGELFRPLEFCNKTSVEQAKIILNLLEIPWTMDDISSWFGEIPAEVNYEEHILQPDDGLFRLMMRNRDYVFATLCAATL